MDELLSPLYQNSFSNYSHVSSQLYINNIEIKVNEALKYFIEPTKIDLIKQYYWGILQYEILKINLLENPSEQIELVLRNYPTSEIQNYLILR